MDGRPPDAKDERSSMNEMTRNAGMHLLTHTIDVFIYCIRTYVDDVGVYFLVQIHKYTQY